MKWTEVRDFVAVEHSDWHYKMKTWPSQMHDSLGMKTLSGNFMPKYTNSRLVRTWNSRKLSQATPVSSSSVVVQHQSSRSGLLVTWAYEQRKSCSSHVNVSESVTDNQSHQKSYQKTHTSLNVISALTKLTPWIKDYSVKRLDCLVLPRKWSISKESYFTIFTLYHLCIILFL